MSTFGVSFWSLGFFNVAKLIWAVFLMLCCPIFFDFLLVQMTAIMYFSLAPVMGEIVVDMSQVLKICARVFCIL